MSGPAYIVDLACNIAVFLLAIAFLLTVYRVIKGPTLPDRVLSLDMLVGIVIGFIAVIAIQTGYTLYIDIAISLGLVGFLATIAFARFILARGVGGEMPSEDKPVLTPEQGREIHVHGTRETVEARPDDLIDADVSGVPTAGGEGSHVESVPVHPGPGDGAPPPAASADDKPARPRKPRAAKPVKKDES